MLLSRRGNCY